MHNEIQNGRLDIAINQGIAMLSFAHPAQNALPASLLSALCNAVESLGRDAAVKVIVLKSEGERTFCAGARFEALSALEDFEQSLEFFSGFARVINAMRKCPKFIIGRVQGKAVGGGVGLAAATDYCLATDGAAIKLSELAVGFGPFVVGPAIERKIGPSAMSQLAIDAVSWRSARWAMEKGLYAAVYDSIPELDAAVETLAGQLAASSPEAMYALKLVCWQGTEHWDELLAERAAISARLALSPFAKTAIATFKNGQKR
ncbi:MAG: enoyl-CoA hydratase/isomerase family protein [Saprospiraceae bacterium]|jgi:methylglutaconyl-CoA hydratase